MTTHVVAAAGESQCARILQRLEEARGGWVPMVELAAVSGAFAVHSRIADLRRRGYPIPRPRITRVREGSGRVYCHSEYRLEVA